MDKHNNNLDDEQLKDDINTEEESDTTSHKFSKWFKDSYQDAQDQEDKISRRERPRLRRHILILAIIVLLFAVLTALGLDSKIVGLAAVAVGLLTHVFSGLIAIVAMVPIIGPLVVKVITLPLFLLINGAASLFAIGVASKGKAPDVFKSKIVVYAFMAGLLIGIVIGIILPHGK